MKYAKVLAALEPHSEVIEGIHLSDIRTAIENLKADLDAARAEGRNLRIAVVGQMKAGKSSFLNAAFFGRDLLPKADTPMTAALTRIVYSPRARAEVEFYNVEDWAAIERRAGECSRRYAEEEKKLMQERQPAGPFALLSSKSQAGPKPEEIRRRLPEDLKASLELVEKARENGLNVREYLGRTEVLEDALNAENLARALHDYVGSGGRYTAITKMTVLYVDDPRLEGLEIIDTPGFNDPVISRGRATRDYLGRCDVIFLLSTVSQFLTVTDMSMLREQLPEAGIDARAVFLVGSQRDVALRQDPNIARVAGKMAERYPPEKRAEAKVAAMLQRLGNKMTELAGQTIDIHLQKPGQDEKTRRILQAVRQSSPCFISAWAWILAENFDGMSPDDREHLRQLQTATGYPFDAESLRSLSNIPALRDEIIRQRERKQELLSGKEQSLMEGFQTGIRNRLDRIAQDLKAHAERIRMVDIAGLETAEKDMVARMQNGRVRVEDVFDEQLTKMKQAFAKLRTDVRAEARKYRKIDVIKESHTESYTVSTSCWYNPFSWGRRETRYREIVTVYASAQDAIEQVEAFAIQTERSLQQAIIGCVDIDGLRRKVGQAAMSLFDTGDADFDAELMLAEVNKSLRRLTVPVCDFGRMNYGQEIVRAFGSDRVSEESIDDLKEMQRKAVAAIMSDLDGEAEKRVGMISADLENTGKNLVDNMTRDIQTSLRRLQEEISDRDRSLGRIAQAEKAVRKEIDRLKKTAA